MLHRRIGALVLCMAFAGITTISSAQHTVHDLGTLPGGDNSQARALNESAQVVGYSDLTSSTFLHAFIWDATNGMQDLGEIGGNYSSAYAINESGQVVGEGYLAAPLGLRHAFIWDATNGIQDLNLNVLAGTETLAFGMNDSTQIVGVYGGASSYISNGGTTLTNLGTLGYETFVRAVNNSGHAVGFSNILPSGVHRSRAFLWTPAKAMQNLGTLTGDASSKAININSHGQVVGESKSSTNILRAFIWDSANGMSDLGQLTGLPYRRAQAINDFGEVVGQAFPDVNEASQDMRPFIWDSVNGMRDVNDLLPPGSGWTLRNATDINNNGDIVGFGIIGGKTRAYLLQYHPAPRPTYTLTTGVVGQGAISLNPLGGTYLEDQQVTVTATPASSWIFASWQGDIAKTAKASTTITMNANKSVTAVFIEIPVPPPGGCGGTISTPGGRSSAAPMVLTVAILLCWAAARRLKTA